MANKLRASGQIQDKDRYIRISEAKRQMVAMLEEIQLEIEEKYPKCDLCEYFVDYDYDENDISEYRSVGSITDITNFIQQKINALKGDSDGA